MEEKMMEDGVPHVWEFPGANEEIIKKLSRRSISNIEIIEDDLDVDKLDSPSASIATTALVPPPPSSFPRPGPSVAQKQQSVPPTVSGIGGRSRTMPVKSSLKQPTLPPLPPGNPPPLPPGPPPTLLPSMKQQTFPGPSGLRRTSSFSSPVVSRKAAPLPRLPPVPSMPRAVSAFQSSPTPPTPNIRSPFPPSQEVCPSDLPKEKPKASRRPRGMSLSGNHGRRSLDSYDKMNQVGGGAYGDVFKARDKESGEVVALKKVRLENEIEGFPVTALREIKFLSQVDHPNIVRLKEVVSSRASESTRNKGSVFMVFEYAESDLVGLMKTKKLSESHVMCIMKQLLEAVHFAHRNQVLHRDIKPSNVLVTSKGNVKLADWGLCRKRTEKRLTNRVVTLWYRAPEVLLGVESYNDAIDVWSCGCVMAEILQGRALLPGKDELDQLHKILELCGNEGAPESWQSLPLAPEFLKAKKDSEMDLRFGYMKPLMRDLIGKMLHLDPAKRISAQDALDHDYFWQEDVKPCLPEHLPTPTGDGVHEFQLKEEEKRTQQVSQQRHNSRTG